MNATTKVLIQALQRKHLHYFVMMVFEIIAPGTVFKDNFHIKALCYQLEQCFYGNSKRFINNQPPRTLKSICVSIAFPAWILGHNPTAKIICVSYAEGLYLPLALDFRRVVESERYRELFPNTHIDPHKNTQQEVGFIGGGYRYATSIGGSLTGRGCDYLLIDDPLNANEVTKTGLKTVNDWFDGVALSRLNSLEQGVVIIAMQRLHINDLVGHVLSKG